MTAVLESKAAVSACFAEARSCLSGPAWLVEAQRAAMGRFTELGFPTAADEDWRFTRVEGLARTLFALPPALPLALTPEAAAWKEVDLQRFSLAAFDAYRLVFIDGIFAPHLSSAAGLPAGVRVQSLAAVLKTESDLLKKYLACSSTEMQAFAALSTALFNDGALVLVPRGVVLEKPVHLLFISAAPSSMQHARVLVVAEPGAKVAIVEEYAGAGAGTCFSNMVTQVLAGENAEVEHTKLQHEGETAFHVASLSVRQERHSRFTGHSLSLGALLCRNDIKVALAGEGADCSLDGLYMVDGDRHSDFHTVIDHAAAHCTSRELFKGVLDGRGRAVFNGLVEVRPNAQKTSASVYNKNLLLSEHGLINTKPEFKINANDVQCRHGATIGQLSPEALFYLRSRGIGAEEARSLLVYAFAREMVDKLGLAPMRQALADRLSLLFQGGS